MGVGKQLVKAIDKNQKVKVNELLRRIGPEDVNETDDDGWTPLHVACWYNNVYVTAKLLTVPGIQVNPRDCDGMTPIMYGALDDSSEALKLLLEHPDIDVNTRDNNGWTPIIYAASKNRSESLKLLLENPDVDVNARDNDGKTAIMWAATRNSSEVLKLLLDHPDVEVNASCDKGGTAIMKAADNNSNEALKLLLEHPDVDVNVGENDGETVIMMAASKNNTEALKLLLEHPYIDVNARYNNGETVMMMAASINNSEALKVLLERSDVDVNARNKDGCTAIMLAASKCSSEALKFLLENPDIDLDVKDNEGRGLEEMVGIIRGNPTDKSKCLEMIAVKRRSESCLEEVRNNVRPHLDSVRKEYIDKIDKNNILNIEIEALKERNEHIVKRKKELEMEEIENNQKMAKLRKITSQLDKDLKRIDLDPDNDTNPANIEALRKNLECPVCMEMMRPPLRIWMCPASHLVCEPCKDRLEGRVCPTCRTGTVNLRAVMAENFARDLFSN